MSLVYRVLIFFLCIELYAKIFNVFINQYFSRVDDFIYTLLDVIRAILLSILS